MCVDYDFIVALSETSPLRAIIFVLGNSPLIFKSRRVNVFVQAENCSLSPTNPSRQSKGPGTIASDYDGLSF